uniref:Kinesin-like protein n=1 Tax=Entomoneis paludosa TaxID=265537 RepID=A0A7S2YAH1_9STRA
MATEANDTSSRSHAICQIMLRDVRNDKLRGKISLVDLAGSERGTDTKSHNSQRRAESADINTSLLALKECIRALDKNASSGQPASSAQHVPYRGSKLTLILKDCFTSSKAMTTMIATVSPGASSTDHSLNTLRYADRIKEHKVGGSGKRSNAVVKLKRKVQQPYQRQQRSEPKLESKESSDDDFYDARAEPVVKHNDEEELQKTVESLMEQEDDILSMHMKNIHENAELLSEEGKLLQDIQRPDATPAELDEYMNALEIVLDRKEDMIIGLQEKLGLFRADLLKEQDLSVRVQQEQH